jgi:hypothetical protein
MASDDPVAAINDGGVCKAEGADAVRDLADLVLAVSPSVPWIGPESANWFVLDRKGNFLLSCLADVRFIHNHLSLNMR